jgi:hypothetical protein
VRDPALLVLEMDAEQEHGEEQRRQHRGHKQLQIGPTGM